MLNRPDENSRNIVDDGASSIGEDEAYDQTVMSVNELTGNQTDPIQSLPSTLPKSPGYYNNSSTQDAPHSRRVIYRFGKFFFHSGIPSFCVRILLFCVILVGFGSLAFSKFRTLEVGHVPVAYTCLIVGWGLLGFVISLGLVHAFVVFCHERRLFYTWNFIHYLSELEKYMAVLICIFVYLVVLSVDAVQVFTDKWIFGSAGLRYLSIKISIGIFLTAVLLAIKRHFMTGLAISFNYSNYKDRIQESLFADRVLNMLQKSKHTYKFRQKWRAQHKEIQIAAAATPTEMMSTTSRLRSPSPGRSRIGSDIPVIVKSNKISHPGGVSPPIYVQSSVRSAMEIFPGGNTGSPAAMGSSLKDQRFTTPSSPLSRQETCTAGPSQTPPVRSVASYLTESDKKRQFSEFFRLANKMMARFANVADYRVEIQNEAKRVSRKLYKYLRPYDRDYLLGQDLLPYIEDEDEFCRAVALIKRNSEGSFQTIVMTFEEAANYAFGSQDLHRAIDGILMEIFVTAKSLQTIETALDKVDFFFTFLVALVMVVVVAIVMGDAVKLLLALSTMLSGAAFAFGTSARNMFESMIFLLVIHPFDVGDRVFVPLGTTMNTLATTFASMSGVDALDNVIVAEMHLLSTVFERWDGVKLYVPNYVLANKPIFNVRRSGALMETQKIHIDFSTPLGKIEELRKRVDEFVRREATDFTDISRVFFDSMENCNKLNLQIIFQHCTNWQDLDTQLARRSKLLSFLKDTLDQLDITYMPPVQRVAIVPQSGNLLSGGEVKRLLELSNKSVQRIV